VHITYKTHIRREWRGEEVISNTPAKHWTNHEAGFEYVEKYPGLIPKASEPQPPRHQPFPHCILVNHVRKYTAAFEGTLSVFHDALTVRRAYIESLLSMSCPPTNAGCPLYLEPPNPSWPAPIQRTLRQPAPASQQTVDYAGEPFRH
jgi:hypothetical protein